MVVDVLALSAALSSCKNALIPLMPLAGGPLLCPLDIFDLGFSRLHTIGIPM